MFDIHKTSAAAYMVAVDGDEFRYVGANQACLELTRVSAAFHPGLTPKDCFPEAVADEVIKRYRACRDTRHAINYLSETKAGLRGWRTTLFPIIDDRGRVATLVGLCADASEERPDDAKTDPHHEKAALALGAIDGGFWVYEAADGTFETSASLAELVAGPGHRSLNLAQYLGYVHVDDLALKDLLNPTDGDRSFADYRVITHEGHTRWLRSRRRVIRDEDGTPARVVGLVVDITDQKERLLALATEAATDPLTSLGNRRAFDRAAARSLERAQADNDAIGLLLIDLDGFKPINDRFGHRAGDAILCKVARRLGRHASQADMLARIGGDEFALLVGKSSTGRTQALASRLARAFDKPFSLDGELISIGVSVGFAVSRSADASIDVLFDRADRDLYKTKRRHQMLTA